MGASLELLQRLEENSIAEIYLARAQGSEEKFFLRRVRRQVAERPEARAGLEAASLLASGVSGEHLLPHAFFDADGVSATWADGWMDGVCLTLAVQRMAARESGLSPPAALLLFEDVCDALSVLHAAGTSFGLLCPEHILLGRDGQARLMAVGFESALLGIKALATQQLRGRRQHLPPEMSRGRPPAPAGDVYAAASLAYLFLTGRLAGGGEESTVSTRHQAIMPPSHACRSLPFACDAVFLKALSSNPSGRPQDGKELSETLRKLRAALVQGKDNSREELSQLAASLIAAEKRLAGGKPPVVLEERPSPPPPSVQPESRELTAPSPPPVPRTSPEIWQNPPDTDTSPALHIHMEDTPTDQFLVQRQKTEAAAGDLQTHDTQQLPMAVDVPPPATPSPPEAALPPPEPAARPARPAAPPVEQKKPPMGRQHWPVVAVGLLLAALFLWWLLRPAPPPPSPPAEQTDIGFLTVISSQPLLLTLDGETLGLTPLERRLLRAGKHRVIARAAGGEVMFDREIVLQPGEHQNLQILESVAPPPPEPPPMVKQPPVKRKPTAVKKKTTRTVKQKSKTRRSRR